MKLRQGAFVLTICVGNRPPGPPTGKKERVVALGSTLLWQLQAIAVSVIDVQYHKNQVAGRSFGGLGC